MTGDVVVLVDCSSSMSEPVGYRTRHDVMSEILREIMPRTKATRLYAFASILVRLDPDRPMLPQPGGSTRLAEALGEVGSLSPRTVVILSDGTADNTQTALEEARKLGCRIETYFCGNEMDHDAVAFLRMLAWCSSDGLGHAAIGDLSQPARLTEALRLTLQ